MNASPLLRLAMTDPVDDAELIITILAAWKATDASRSVARATLTVFSRWLAEHGTTIAAATEADCIDWLRHRRDTVAPGTLVKNWSQLRAFYKVAAADILDPLDGRISPMTRIPMPSVPAYSETHVATEAEVDALCRTFDLRTGVGLRNMAMISLMFRSGLRVGELAQIEVADLDLERRSIRLASTKNGEPRRPPLHPETITVLGRYMRRRGDFDGPLFLNVGGRRTSERLTTTAIQNVVKKAAAAAGSAVTPHCLRRGFVVWYLTHGGDAASLMVICGWKTEAMIYRYMGESRAATAQAVFDRVTAHQIGIRRRNLRAVE